MCDCKSAKNSVGGPFATGRDLVEFVLKAHGGDIAISLLPNGGMETKCQGCGTVFTMKTFVQCCLECNGVHAVSPPRATDHSAIQFAGKDFVLSAGL